MVKLLKLNQRGYPSSLSKIEKPPDPLYCLGDPDFKIFNHCLAVVGSRKMSDYGRQAIEKLLPEVVEAGVTIVSGFMHGIDETAHRVCLESKGRTIAVLGCGIDLVRPTVLKDLHEKILAGGGLIVSELEGEHPPFRWTFVRRNRIISGLSQATLVVEAGEESGSLITAQFAKKQKRKVLAVPGPIGASGSRGTAKLIRQGATLISTAWEILQALGIKADDRKKRVLTGLSQEEKKILDFIGEGDLSADEISRGLKVPSAQLGSLLSILLVKGRLKQNSRSCYYLP